MCSLAVLEVQLSGHAFDRLSFSAFILRLSPIFHQRPKRRAPGSALPRGHAARPASCSHRYCGSPRCLRHSHEYERQDLTEATDRRERGNADECKCMQSACLVAAKVGTMGGAATQLRFHIPCIRLPPCFVPALVPQILSIAIQKWQGLHDRDAQPLHQPSLPYCRLSAKPTC